MNNDNPGWMNEPNLGVDLAQVVARVMMGCAQRPVKESELAPQHYWIGQAIILRLVERGLINDLGLQILERDK